MLVFKGSTEALKEAQEITYQVLVQYHTVQDLSQSLWNGSTGRQKNSRLQFCNSWEIMVIVTWGQKARFLCTACLQSQQRPQNVMWTHTGNWELTQHISYSTREMPLVLLLIWQCRLTRVQCWDHHKIWKERAAPSCRRVRHVSPSNTMTVKTYQEDDTIWTPSQDLYHFAHLQCCKKTWKMPSVLLS